MIKTVHPEELATKDLHQYIVGAITPRPIALVSTIDADGVANVAPYSFFNAFSSNPPILVFSSNRRVRDNTTKDTLRNVREQGEVVVNIVNHAMVRQMALSSVEWDSSDSEFDKTGLTKLDSLHVAPYRVAESPIQMECKVQDIITLGDHGGAGHLVICHVQCIHVDTNILGEKDRIDPAKLDVVGRLGRAYYTRVTPESIFTLVQPVLPCPIGYDSLPDMVKHSDRLTGNMLGALAGIATWPTDERVASVVASEVGLSLDGSIDDVENWAIEAIKQERYEEALIAYIAYESRIG